MQKRRHSALETVIGTAIGFAVSLFLQLVFYPLVGIHVPLGIDFLAVAVFTIASLIRGYYVRRLFNRLHLKGILK